VDEAHARGIGAARGVIIMGVQGCGKSMCARAIAANGAAAGEFDTAAIYDKYVGETESEFAGISP